MANSLVPLLDAAAARYGLPPNLLVAQAGVESSFRPGAVSPAGAQGVLQLMPTTARALGVQDPMNPQQNIDGGARLMQQDLQAAHGNVRQALRLYHGGTDPANWGPKTEAYVDKVTKTMNAGSGPVTVQDLDNLYGGASASTGAPASTAPLSGAPATSAPSAAPVSVADLDKLYGGPAAAPAQPQSAEQVQASGPERFLAGVGKGFADVGQTLLGVLPGKWAARHAAELKQTGDLYDATKPTVGMDVGQVVGQTAATLPAMVATDGAIGAGAARVGAALGDTAAGNVVRGVGKLLTGTAGADMTGAPGLVVRGASAAAQGALYGGEANALTGQPVKQGAEYGVVLGPAFRVLSAGAGAAKDFAGNLLAPMTTDMSPAATARAATNRLVQAAARDGVKPEQIVSKMREMGPQATPIDAVSALTTKSGANVRQLGEEVALTPGPAQGKAAQVLESRAQEAPARINAAVKEATGASGNIHAQEAELMQQRAAAAKPLYEAAFARPVTMTDRIRQFLADPFIQSQMTKGSELQRLEGLTSGEGFDPQAFAGTSREAAPATLLDANGQPIQGLAATTQVPTSMQAIDAAKRGLDDAIQTARAAGQADRARVLNGVRTSLLQEVDAAHPEYAAARAAWAGPSQAMDALNLGRQALTEDPEITSGTVSQLSPSEKEFFLSGVTRALQDKIAGAQDGADVTRKIFGNSLIRSKIAAAFDDPQAFSRFEHQMANEAQFAATRNEVLKGSQTARRLLGAAGAPDIATPINHLVRGDVGSAARTGVNALSQWAMRPSEKQLAARGDLLFNQDPDAVEQAFAKVKRGRFAVGLRNALTDAGRAAAPGSLLGYEFNQSAR